MTDIVDRLRIWSKGTEQQGAVVLSMALTEAADTIDRLTAERDEARRWICEQKASISDKEAKWWAEVHTWDCYKEDGK